VKKNYAAFLEHTARLEVQLVEVDSKFNEVQVNFRQAIEQKENKNKLEQAELQKIGNALAGQNSRLAQVDAKLESIVDLEFNEFEERDTLLFSDLEKIKANLLIINNELKNIDTQIEQIKK